MTPRVFAILVCLVASGRWPRLRYVAAALGCELVADTLSTYRLDARWPTAVRAAWFASTSVLVALATNLRAGAATTVATFAIAQGAALSFARWVFNVPLLIVCVSCAIAALSLLRRTVPRDVERSALLAALVGNVATSALAMFVGVDDAYAKEVVSTSNQITHLAIAAIVLWAMRR